MLKDLLQGKPLRHPLHPAVVHFPIGLFVLSLCFDVAGLLGFGQRWIPQAAAYTMALALATALLASVPGLVDYLDIRSDHPAKRIATYHMLLNLLAVAVYTGSFVLRYRDLESDHIPLAGFALSLCGIAILSVSGYLGGVLVYDNGIGVGRHRRRTPTPDRTLKADSPRSGGFFVVAEDSGLAEGATLRAEVKGQVIAIVKLAGKVYAFQEFCTHRYGPLSEGSLQDGNVVCPWHRSVFNVRTGKVVAGPAKVDLKTFEVKIEDGQVLVRARES